MSFTVRAIEAHELEAFVTTLVRNFGADAEPDDIERVRRLVAMERALAAFDGSELVGTCAAFSFELTLPGGAVPMAGTSMVTVKPTHRRRGVLSAMLRVHLDQAVASGEPLAGLWASETSIYGRFGFGLAATAFGASMNAGHLQFSDAEPDGEVRLLDARAAAQVLPDVYDRVRRARPGMLDRTPAWWDERIIGDPKHTRGGASEKRFAVYYERAGNERAAHPDGVARSAPEIGGYAIFRQMERWDPHPQGEVRVVEVIAESPAAHSGLWRFLARIDLFPNVSYPNLPVDDELPLRLTEWRRVQRRLKDTLWLRPLDLPAVLQARRYASSDEFVLEIRDGFRPQSNGRYLLTTDAQGARCTPSTRTPDVVADVGRFGALLLGGHSAQVEARAGRLDASPATAARLDQAFAADRAPWSAEMF